MIVVSVGMVPYVDIVMSDEFSAWLIWLVFVQKDRIASSCSKLIYYEINRHNRLNKVSNIFFR